MNVSRVVVALGGNALGNTPGEQIESVDLAAKALVSLIALGHEVIVTHGNGPQVGMIKLAMDGAADDGTILAPMPLPECVAMSQGYIGYHLQNAISNEIALQGMSKTVVSLITQVVVEAEDPAFQNPTKPIGYYYTREEAEALSQSRGEPFMEDAGRGYRRVVASPRPVDIEEKEAIVALIKSGSVVIAVGGGGVPVIKCNNRLTGVTAVIDKDLASAKLAALVEADILVILTAVEAVAIHFGTPAQYDLRDVSASQMEEYISQNQFAPGSMLPKVTAALDFLAQNPQGKVLITSLENALGAMENRNGTRIAVRGGIYAH